MANASDQATPPYNGADGIIDAFMALAAEQDFADIRLSDIAARAGVTLGELRDAFGSRLDILAAYMKRVDRAVLDGIDNSLKGEETKDKLFDVLMRRLDVLAPHKGAIRGLAKAARRDPGLAMALNRLAVRSQRWMLAAADIELTGPGGAVRAQGLAWAFGKVLAVWLDDDDPALARTMKALDEQLAKAGRAAGALKTFEQVTAPLRGLACLPLSLCRGRNRRSRDRDREEPQERGWRGDDLRDPQVTPV